MPPLIPIAGFVVAMLDALATDPAYRWHRAWLITNACQFIKVLDPLKDAEQIASLDRDIKKLNPDTEKGWSRFDPAMYRVFLFVIMAAGQGASTGAIDLGEQFTETVKKGVATTLEQVKNAIPMSAQKIRDSVGRMDWLRGKKEDPPDQPPKP